MTADSAANRTCRNTIVVLITGGRDNGDAGYNASHNTATTASSFLSVTASGVTKRVPIAVIAVKPNVADVASLQAIATNSGGFYFSASTAFEVTAAVDRAVQQAFARSADFDTSTTSEFSPVSPIVGTVNLKNARDANGSVAAEHRHHRQSWWSGSSTAQQFPADGRFHAARVRRRAARVPNLQAGRGFDEADRVEIRE